MKTYIIQSKNTKEYLTIKGTWLKDETQAYKYTEDAIVSASKEQPFTFQSFNIIEVKN